MEMHSEKHSVTKKGDGMGAGGAEENGFGRAERAGAERPRNPLVWEEERRSRNALGQKIPRISPVVRLPDFSSQKMNPLIYNSPTTVVFQVHFPQFRTISDTNRWKLSRPTLKTGKKLRKS